MENRDIIDACAVYLCECGTYRHRMASKFCTICGRKIDVERKNPLADQVEDLLVDWEKAKGVKALRLARARLGERKQDSYHEVLKTIRECNEEFQRLLEQMLSCRV